MIDQSLAHPAPPPPPTRELRGLALYVSHGVYIVPGCSGGTYTVDLAAFGGEESCNCPDYQRHKEPCKHVYAGTIYRSKARAKARREQAARTTARASRASLTPLASL